MDKIEIDLNDNSDSVIEIGISDNSDSVIVESR